MTSKLLWPHCTLSGHSLLNAYFESEFSTVHRDVLFHSPSGGISTMAVISPPERKLAKCTSVQCTAIPVAKAICITFATLEINKINHLRISISKLFSLYVWENLTREQSRNFDINEILLVYGSFSSFVSSHYHDTVTYYVKGRRGLI